MTIRKAPRRKSATQAPPRAGSGASGRRNLLHVASRIFNTPLLIDPRKLEAIVAGLKDQMNVAIELPQVDFAREPMAFDPSWDEFSYDDWMTITDGVAVLHIDGTLVHKGSWLGTYSGLISYDGISEQLQRVRQRHAAGEIRALLLNMHTHGGEVAGCFDLVDEIYALRETLPIVALVADAACSAGYAIASAAHEIVVTQAGYAGSIGVVYTHYDYSQHAEQQGIAITHIYAGEEKILGSPFKPLSDADKEKLQDEIDGLYELFVEKVARNRNMDIDDVRETEAAVFYAEEAVELGLADRVAAPREVLAELQEQVSIHGAVSRQVTTGETSMAKRSKTAAKAEVDEQAVEAAATTFVGALKKALGIGKSGAAAKKAADEDDDDRDVKKGEDEDEEETSVEDDEDKEDMRKSKKGEDEDEEEPGASALARADAILSCAEAAGRSSLARHLAFKTKLSVSAAREVLKQAAKDASSNPLAAAMDKIGTPGIGAEDQRTPAPARINSQSIYESRRKATRSH